jgi:hypothetical protein
MLEFVQLTQDGFMQYGNLKTCRSAFILLLIAESQIQIFLKAHVA